MKTIRIASYLLSFLMLTALLAFGVMAADEEYKLSTDYLTEVYVNEQEKLATMGVVDEETGERKPNFENDEYEIWAHAETGEVGFRVKETGQIILTNPYDVGTSTANDEVKKRLLSQILLTYKDSSGALVNFSSYGDAALNGQVIKNVNVGQIKIKNTRKGIRVEYTLGKEQAKYVVPRQIEKESFEKNLIEEWEDKSSRDYAQFVAYYDLKDPFDETLAPTVLSSMKTQFKATEKYAIYVLDPGVSNRELEMLASFIENNTSYDAEQMEADYELIDYVDTSAAPALFRMAIEYSLDENGIEISMPANSIRYDSSNYTLVNVKLLPYLGAGNNDNEGFTLLPDGSGTITRFEDIKGKPFTLTGKLYGKDYSYHTISGYTQETMRLPAFGVLETSPFIPTPEKEEEAEEVVEETTEETTEESSEETAEETAEGETAEETATETEAAETEEAEAEETAEEVAEEVVEEGTKYITDGFVAYFTEGDSLAEFSSDHGGTVHNYSSVYATFYPRPTDTYALTGISSTGDASWEISSDRKYVGGYTMRILPVYGEDSDYTDMAAVLREYLEKTGTLTKMDPAEDKSEDVSLYIENFGTIKTDEKFLGFPVKKQTPLTTFEQTQTMIAELQEAGVNNINVKLTGWYNGGMEHTAPSKLKVPSSVGGMDGLKELVAYAAENGVDIYPDLDFTYVSKFSTFDGLSVKNDTAKTIDGRSAEHRIYNALYQGFEPDDKALISPAVMTEFYEKIEKKFEKLGTGAVSLASVGSDLNSDHNEDYALNRDDAEQLVAEFLEYVSAENKVMVDGGNAYTIKYADHILSVPLDSSMNINTSVSVPFMGMVLHGYTEFAGTAINLDGDYDYSVLKAIENGANLYFLVSKDNTAELKAFPEFSKYYAIRYDNWKNDIIDTYLTFNEVMKGVKYSALTEHEYIGTRLVRVAYENGTEFVLNYNTHQVSLDDGTTVEAMSFVVR